MNLLKNLLIALLILLFIRCQKDDQKSDFFALFTEEVKINGSSQNGVELSANILIEGNQVLLESGFVWALNKRPTLDDNALKTENITGGHFKIEMKVGLIPDTTYYVRSFVKTSTDLTYGNEVSFYSTGSEPPLIDKIEPELGFWGDTIMITGENFDYTGKDNTVLFNSITATNSWGNMDTIFAVVPKELNRKKSGVTINLYGQRSENHKEFEIRSPEIHSISQTEGEYPDTVILKGKNFSKDFAQLKWGEKILQNVQIHQDKIMFQIPFNRYAGETSIKLEQLGETKSVTSPFKYRQQSISGLSLDSMFYRDTIVVYGENIDFERADLSLFLGEFEWEKTNVWKDSIQFFYSGSIYDYHATSFEISARVNDFETHQIFSTTIKRRNPYIEQIEKTDLVYMDEIITLVKGVHGRGKEKLNFSLYDKNNSIVARETPGFQYSSNHQYTISLPKEITPGQYTIKFENYLRSSNRINIEVKEPVITSFGNQSTYKRGQDIEINGEYLPNTPRAYQLRHESGRVIKRDPDEHWYQREPEIYPTLNIIGKGEYSLEFIIGNEVIPTNLSVYLDDYFEYTGLYDEYDFNEAKGQVCFAGYNKLYYLIYKEPAIRIIDINTGEVTKVKTNITLTNSNEDDFGDDRRIFPAIVNGEVFIRHDYKLYSFNFETNQWKQRPITSENDSILRIANINNELAVNTINGDVLKYNGSWTKIGEANWNYYTFGVGDYYYTGYYFGFSRVSLADFDTFISLNCPLRRSSYYYTFRHLFVYKNDMYEGLTPDYYLKIAKLSTSEATFEEMDPPVISRETYASRFFPDINGDVYYLDETAIFKFMPD